jgi:anaerobic magnesium-protoporphyrin IX monomethyl ester cyclase
MKISLISLYPDITSLGIRVISAYLKQHGHKTQLIFLPDPYGDDIEYGKERYENHILEEVISLCQQSDLIGITLMTNFFDGAVQLTKKLKKELSTPVIWGGVHPTIKPEECLEYADIICIGEGEDAMLELVNKMSRGEDYLHTINLWINTGNQVIKNPLSPLPRDLDIYPFPDYSMDDHHIMINDQIVPISHKVTELFLKGGTVSKYLGKTGYQTMTSRGCPHSCAYCINHTIKEMYGSKGKLRWRSVNNVIEELMLVKREMSYVNYIWISDDEFMAQKIDNLKEFAIQYKAKIGLPFSCLVSPLSVTEEKMSLLVGAGLIYVQMGIESGSVRMQRLYNREIMNNKRMMKAITIINKFKDKMYPPSYDFLVDVPFETDEDRIDSLRFISNIPKPFRLQPFTLILYPGTLLYEMAKKNVLVIDEYKEIYEKTYTMRKPEYLNLLMTLSKKGKFPSPLLKILITSPIVNILNSKALKPLFKFIYIGMKNVYSLLKNVNACL